MVNCKFVVLYDVIDIEISLVLSAPQYARARHTFVTLAVNLAETASALTVLILFTRSFTHSFTSYIEILQVVHLRLYKLML